MTVPRGEDHVKKVEMAELSYREAQVLKLLCRGESTDEMATHLELSPATVRNHVRFVREKLGCRSKGAAIASAYRTGLVKAPKPRNAPSRAKSGK